MCSAFLSSLCPFHSIDVKAYNSSSVAYLLCIQKVSQRAQEQFHYFIFPIMIFLHGKGHEDK